MRNGRHRRGRLLSTCREPRLRLGVGDGQPDAVLGLLRGARARRPADHPSTSRDRRIDLRHPDTTGARRGDGDPQPPRAREGPPRDRDRQYRDAHHGPAPDADPRVRRVPAGAPGAPSRGGGGLRVQRRPPAGQDADARVQVHESRAPDSRSTSPGSDRARWGSPGSTGTAWRSPSRPGASRWAKRWPTYAKVRRGRGAPTSTGS